MNYTTPIYNKEKVETTDIMEESIVKIAYVNKVIGQDGEGKDIVVPTTQVTVDVSNLF